MRVVVFETEEWERQACLRLSGENSVACTHEALDLALAARYTDAEIVSPFVNSRLTADVLTQFGSLKLVATRSTGFDHIDIAYCRSRGITVCNVPDYGDFTVAEHVFALLLAISRNIPEAVERTRRGNFGQAGLRGFDLRGKTVGVIGTGRIGRRTIEIAKGFGMAVIAHDVKPDAHAAETLRFRYAELSEVLKTADVVTLHVPANPQTRGIISDPEFELMKTGAVLINTARGDVVDTAALVRALAGGKLRAAGLDVLPQEPVIREEAQVFRVGARNDYDLRALVANHVLLRFPNVIVTPHNAYNTDGAVSRIVETTLNNISAFIQGRPQNVIPG